MLLHSAVSLMFSTGSAVATGVAGQGQALAGMDPTLLGQDGVDVYIGPEVQTLSSLTRNHIPGEKREEIEKLLDRYGSYPLPEEKAREAQKVFETTIRRLRRDGDPELTFIYVNSPEVNAFVSGDKDDAVVVVFRGLLDCIETEEELAAILGHEIGHTVAFGKQMVFWKKGMDKPLEELSVADKEAIRRLFDAGYDPRGAIKVHENLAKRLWKRPKGNLISVFLDGFSETHPGHAIRISQAARWVSELEAIRAFPESQPLPAILAELKKTKASNGIVREVPAQKEVEEAPVKRPDTQPVFKESPEPKPVHAYPDYELYESIRKDPGFQAKDPEKKLIFVQSLRRDTEFKGSTIKRTHRGAEILFQMTLQIVRESGREDIQIRAARAYCKLPGNEELALQIYPPPVFADLRKFQEFKERLARQYPDLIHRDRPFPYFYQKIILADLYRKAKTPGELIAVAKAYQEFHRLDGSHPGDRLEELYEAGLIENDAEIVTGQFFPSYEPKVARLLQQALEHGPLSTAEKMVLSRVLRDQYLKWTKPVEQIVAEEVHSISEFLDILQEYRLKTEMPLDYNERYRNAFVIDPWPFILKHPEWGMTLEELDVLWNDQQLWHSARTDYALQRDYAWGTGNTFERLESWLKARDEKELAKTISVEEGRIQGLAYEYNAQVAEPIQRFVIQQLRRAGLYPSDPAGEFKLFMKLTARGVTALTDQWALELFAEGSPLNNEAHTILAQGRVWDFDARKKVYERLRQLETVQQLNQGIRPLAVLVNRLVEIHRFFPEPSLARAELMEKLANEVGATVEETRLVESLKVGEQETLAGVALRGFNGLLASLYAAKDKSNKFLDSPKERQFQFIRFLVGEGEAPRDLKKKMEEIGAERLRRQFQSLTPDLKVQMIDPLLRTDEGLYADPAYRRRLIDLALSGMGGYQQEAELVLESILYALRRTAPYQETFVMAFVLGQLGDQAISPAQRLRAALEALGNTGVSIAQKLYQRRLLPDEFLAELADLQDEARKPTRMEIFERMGEVLGIATEDLDKTIVVEKILGSASSKMVVQVRYKDGRVAGNEPRALKILRRHFTRTTDLEIAKVGHMVDYLVEHGGRKYQRLRPALQVVERSLRKQADTLAEAKVVGKVAPLYETGSGAVPGFRFAVVRPDLTLSHGEDHVHETVAVGSALKLLEGEERARTFAAIYRKEEEILFAGREDDGGEILFERDRHLGNYRADIAPEETTIGIFDYALLSTIRIAQRNAVLQLLGLLSALKGAHLQTKRNIIAKKAVAILLDEMTAPVEGLKRLLVEGKLKKYLEDPKNLREEEVTALMLNLLAQAESIEGVNVDPAVSDYLISLGHAELYASAAADGVIAGGVASNPLRQKVAEKAAQLLAGFREEHSWRTLFSKFLRRTH